VTAWKFDSKGSAVSEISKRSDQPRCCGNPSWTTPAGIYGGWLPSPIQFVCHCSNFRKALIIQLIDDIAMQYKR
jgi:hypothetical protein